MELAVNIKCIYNQSTVTQAGTIYYKVSMQIVNNRLLLILEMIRNATAKS